MKISDCITRLTFFEMGKILAYWRQEACFPFPPEPLGMWPWASHLTPSASVSSDWSPRPLPLSVPRCRGASKAHGDETLFSIRRHELALVFSCTNKVRKASILLILGNIHEENKDLILNGGKTWLGAASRDCLGWNAAGRTADSKGGWGVLHTGWAGTTEAMMREEPGAPAQLPTG